MSCSHGLAQVLEELFLEWPLVCAKIANPSKITKRVLMALHGKCNSDFNLVLVKEIDQMIPKKKNCPNNKSLLTFGNP